MTNINQKTDLIEEIRLAFRDVTRGGGVSWAQTEILDNYGLPPRGKPIYHDRDDHWEDLIDDAEWHLDPGVGGHVFLDEIGFRYYLPAAMIRSIREGDDSEMDGWLSGEECFRQKRTLLDDRQRNSVAQFIDFMESLKQDRHAEYYGEGL